MPELIGLHGSGAPQPVGLPIQPVAQIQVMPLFKIMALFLPRGQAEQHQPKTGRYMQLFARRQQLP